MGFFKAHGPLGWWKLSGRSWQPGGGGESARKDQRTLGTLLEVPEAIRDMKRAYAEVDSPDIARCRFPSLDGRV